MRIPTSTKSDIKTVIIGSDLSTKRDCEMKSVQSPLIDVGLTRKDGCSPFFVSAHRLAGRLAVPV